MKTLDGQRWTARDAQWGAPLWARALLVIAALGAVGLRFADRDLVPYILDEPRFQDAATTHAEAGTWPSISPLTGNVGLAYGPGPVWFYTAVHHLVGPKPERSILAATLFASLTLLILAGALARAMRGGTVVFATLTVLLASSPFLFFWSRMAWEVFACYVALAVAVLATDKPLGLGRGTLLGILFGLALTSHPMTAPVVLASFIVLGWEAARRRAGAAGLLALVAAIVVVNVPYLLAVLHSGGRAPQPPGPSLGGRALAMLGRLGGELLEPARVLTTTGIDYFFDAAWPNFRAWLGTPAALLAMGPALAFFLALLGAAGLLWAGRCGGRGLRRVARVGLLAWVGTAVLLSGLGLAVHPHYQFSTWWIVPAGVGGLAMALLPRHAGLARGLLVSVWVLSMAQTVFNRAWMGWIRERGGTAGIHYSVPLSGQRALLQAACATERPQVALANQTYLFPDSLLSLARTEPACAEKRVAICRGRCPVLDAQWSEVSVRYAAYPGGRLAFLVSQ